MIPNIAIGWKVFYFECEERIENRKDGWEKRKEWARSSHDLNRGTLALKAIVLVYSSCCCEVLCRQNKFFTAIAWACGVEVDVLLSFQGWGFEHVKKKLLNISDY